MGAELIDQSRLAQAELWPNAGLTSEVHDPNWEQFQLLDVVRFKVISLLRHVEPSRIAEASPYAQRVRFPVSARRWGDK